MPSKCHTALAAPGKCSVRKPPPLSRSNMPVKPHSSPGWNSHCCQYHSSSAQTPNHAPNLEPLFGAGDEWAVLSC